MSTDATLPVSPSDDPFATLDPYDRLDSSQLHNHWSHDDDADRCGVCNAYMTVRVPKYYTLDITHTLICDLAFHCGLIWFHSQAFILVNNQSGPSVHA